MTVRGLPSRQWPFVFRATTRMVRTSRPRRFAPKHGQITWIRPWGDVPLTLLVGGYAQARHLGRGKGVTATVADWRAHAPRLFPLPHPSWRNTGWLKKNPWFEAELLPELQKQVAIALTS